MNNSTALSTFSPQAPDAAGVLSWIHIGDLHLTETGEQNHLDLEAIVDEINQVFADSISFVYLPGDNADHGDPSAYRSLRQALDRLRVPWCAIVGDHDVQTGSFDHFRAALAEQTHYAFTVGNTRFVAMNAFDMPHPKSFSVQPEQLLWADRQCAEAAANGHEIVMMLHCYPSDLKEGGAELAQLIRKHSIKLVDMGHTHYNEIGNDGQTLYTATRSTGQIEEGPVGFSVTSLDGSAVSWRFLELGYLPAVVITTPADERLLSDNSQPHPIRLPLRAKVWSQAEVATVEARLNGETVPMRRVPGSHVWGAILDIGELPNGTHPLRVIVQDHAGHTAEDEIRFTASPLQPARERAPRDVDNALEAWPEHGLLGTQLGPNKNGRK